METPNTPVSNNNISTVQHVTVQIIVDGYPFSFSLPVGAKLGNALDAAFGFLSHVNTLINDAVAKSQPQQVTEDKKG